MIFNVTENMHIQTQKIIDDKTGVKKPQKSNIHK